MRASRDVRTVDTLLPRHGGPAAQPLSIACRLSEKPPSLVVPETPDRADHDIIYARLVEFEADKAGPPEILPLAVLLKDEVGTTIGGLWGTSVFRWLVVSLVFIPERCRGDGFGTKIMAEAERIAKERGCIGIWLDTYSFQAPAFYERLGFERFGAVDDHPPGRSRIFMRKRLG